MILMSKILKWVVHKIVKLFFILPEMSGFYYKSFYKRKMTRRYLNTF